MVAVIGWCTPMRLEGRGGNALELTVLRYQFAGGDNEFDLNWLEIRGVVAADGRLWTFEDPCLLTSEARSLGSWLRHVTNPLADYERLTFMEPNLAFDVSGRTDEMITVRVYFDLEARPADLVDADEDECWIDLELRPELLLHASETWLAELEAYPVRKV